MNYKIGICDDEYTCRENIKKTINNYFSKNNNTCSIYEFSSGQSVLESAQKLDILFLDIEMDGINGLEVKDQITTIDTLSIVFVTNYQHHMGQAFGKNVIAFINKDEIYKIDEILSQIEKKELLHQQIRIGNDSFDTFDILYAKADGAYTTIYLKDTNVLCCIYLNDFLKKIPNYNFTRVHRSYVVNLFYVKDILATNVLLSNNNEIPLSRSYKKDFTDIYFRYIRSVR